MKQQKSKGGVGPKQNYGRVKNEPFPLQVNNTGLSRQARHVA